jgi:hypothetical protein
MDSWVRQIQQNRRTSAFTKIYSNNLNLGEKTFRLQQLSQQQTLMKLRLTAAMGQKQTSAPTNDYVSSEPVSGRLSGARR